MKIIYKHLYSSEKKLENLGHGEWLEEPDEAHFIYKNIKCKVLRIINVPTFKISDYSSTVWNPGHLCGYCYLPENHPWLKLEEDIFSIESDVHGGITFFEGNEIGFDASHSLDFIPETKKINELLKKRGCPISLLPASGRFKKTYKNMDFMIEECKKLAEEINLSIEKGATS